MKMVFGVIQALLVIGAGGLINQLGGIKKELISTHLQLNRMTDHSEMRDKRIDALESMFKSDTARLAGAAPVAAACKAERSEQFAMLMAGGQDPAKAWQLASTKPCDHDTR